MCRERTSNPHLHRKPHRRLCSVEDSHGTQCSEMWRGSRVDTPTTGQNSLSNHFLVCIVVSLLQTLGHRGTCSHRKSEDDIQMTENILPRVDLFNHAYSMNLLKYFREFYISLLKYHFFQFVREVVNSIHGQGPSWSENILWRHFLKRKKNKFVVLSVFFVL